MTNQELVEFYDTKPWATNADIKRICRCGHGKAKEIIMEINESRRRKNQFIHDEHKVPTTMLFKRLGIDIQQIKKCS